MPFKAALGRSAMGYPYKITPIANSFIQCNLSNLTTESGRQQLGYLYFPSFRYPTALFYPIHIAGWRSGISAAS